MKWTNKIHKNIGTFEIKKNRKDIIFDWYLPENIDKTASLTFILNLVLINENVGKFTILKM